MCLVTDTKTVHYAPKAIAVFKVMLKHRVIGGKHISVKSPFQRYQYKLGEMTFMPGKITPIMHHDTEYYMVEEGLHSYTNMQAALTAAWNMHQDNGPVILICQATIPNRARYCESYNYDEIVSDSLVIEKVLFEIPYVPLIYT